MTYLIANAMNRLVVLLSVTVLVSCGGSGSPSEAPTTVGVPIAGGIQPASAVVPGANCARPSVGHATISGQCVAVETGPLRAMGADSKTRSTGRLGAATQDFTPDIFLDWVERTFASYFPGHQATVVRDGFVFRHYPLANSFVAVTTDGGVYVLFGNVDSQVKYVTQMRDYACLVMQTVAACPPVLTPSSVSPVLADSPIVISSNQPLSAILSAQVESSLGGSIPVAATLSNDKRSISIWPIARFPDGATLTVTVSATNADGALGTVTGELATTPFKIVACQEITTSGNYLVQNDISANTESGVCIAIHDTHNVQVDCANHAISGFSVLGRAAIEIRTVRNFSIKNCTVQTSGGGIVEITDSSIGRIIGSSLSMTNPMQATVNVTRTDHLVFDNNDVVGLYQQMYGDNNTISNNRISALPGPGMVAGLILLTLGSHNTVSANTLDGRTGGARPPGTQGNTDDGIVIQDESNVLIRDNTIRSVFDCGIETVGTIASATIRGNRIEDALFCGIGGWYWHSLIGSTIEHNTVERSMDLFYFFRAYGLRPARWDPERRAVSDTAVMFRDNVFDGNILIDRAESADYLNVSPAVLRLYDQLDYSGGVSAMSGERAATPADFQLTNNVFRNNQFGRARPAPSFGVGVPKAGMVIDGGGNVCNAPATTEYPLNCN